MTSKKKEIPERKIQIPESLEALKGRHVYIALTDGVSKYLGVLEGTEVFQEPRKIRLWVKIRLSNGTAQLINFNQVREITEMSDRDGYHSGNNESGASA